MSAGCVPVSILTEKKLLDGSAKPIINKVGDIPIYTAEADLLRNLTGFDLTRGALAAMKRPEEGSLSEILKTAKRIAVLEEIADSTNVGAIFRSAAALGIDAVLITPTCCDPLCRRAVRVSMGTVFLIPFAKVGESKEDWLENGTKILNSYGFKTVAMALRDDSVGIDDEALMNEERLAIILGTEGTGLSGKTIESCNYTVKIPMMRGVDSLNVGAAAAIAFWQLAKR